MTKQNQGPATFVIPDTPTPPSFRTITSTPVLPDALIPTLVISDALPPLSSRTRQRAGIQLLGEMFYLRQIFKVRCFTGYRLGGRYDDNGVTGMQKALPKLSQYLRLPHPPLSSSRIHFPLVIPDALTPTFVISDALPPLSSRTRQRAGIQLRQVMLYPRQIFKVRWFTGYRLEGRYDEIKPMSRNLRYLGRAYLPPTPSRTHFPLVIPDATASRDPVTPWHEAVYAKPKHGSAFAVILTR
jgi:hypothetical protein